MARKSGYRLRFGASARALLNYVTYLVSIPGAVGGGLPVGAPLRFEAADWEATPGVAGVIQVEILALPETTPPREVTGIDYRLDGGDTLDWTDAEVLFGLFLISGLDPAEYEVEIRSRGEGGPSPASDIKLVEVT